jgi:hypothetical protein
MMKKNLNQIFSAMKLNLKKKKQVELSKSQASNKETSKMILIKKLKKSMKTIQLVKTHRVSQPLVYQGKRMTSKKTSMWKTNHYHQCNVPW